MSVTKTATVTGRVNIPVSPETRSEMEKIASNKGVSLAELGRQAIETFLTQEHRQQRLRQLRDNAIKYADIIDGVADDWQATEVEGWPDE